MYAILNVIAYITFSCIHEAFGIVQPTLYWTFDARTSDRFINEANSSTNNRGLLLPDSKIVRNSGWTVAKLKGNRSGILIDNVTNTCFLVPESCKSGISISFHIKWPRNSTYVKKNGSLISSGNFSVVHESGGNLIVSLWNGTSEWQLNYARNTSVHGWLCYIVTWNHTSLRLYINGNLKSAIGDDTQILWRNGILKNRSMISLGDRAIRGRMAIGNVATIGCEECGLKMAIDDFKIWDVALANNDTQEACYRATSEYNVGQNEYKYQDQVYTSINFAHRALHGFTFSCEQVENLNSCIRKCMEMKHKCMSFNIGKEGGAEGYICQLNKNSREHFPQDIIEKYNYYYYDVYWKT